MGKPVRKIKTRASRATARIDSSAAARIEKIGRVSSTSVETHTGRGWAEWVALLEKAGARNWPHSEITQFLKARYKLSAWWQQGVAIGYELHAGKRIEGRNEKGLYATVASKTLPLAQAAAWKFLSSPAGQEAWLRPFAPLEFRKGAAFEVDGGVFGEVRTVKPGFRLRFSWKEETWAKPSVAHLEVHPRKGEKCMVVIQHGQIPNPGAKEKLRARWKAALERVAALSSSRPGA